MTLLAAYLLDPTVIAVLLLVAAMIAEHHGGRRLARGLVTGTALMLAAFALLPLDAIIARPLEDQYPRPALPAHVDGIVVLSGGLALQIYASRGVVGENTSTMRMLAGAELALRFPKAKFVFSGTISRDPAVKAIELKEVEQIFRSVGVAPGRTLYERDSVNTWENLAFTKNLVHPKPGETWVLVTSAVHLPRVMGVARRLGWNLVPWPAEYMSTAEWRARPLEYPAMTLTNFDRAVHEWLGLIAYRLNGEQQ